MTGPTKPPALRAFRGVLPQLGARVHIDPAAVVIGRVTLADDVSIWPCAVLRGDVATIAVGARSNIQDGTVVHVTSPSAAHPDGVGTVIGREVTVGHKVVLHACTIGNGCLIGMGAIVLDDVLIEDEVFVAAGALVTPGKRLEARSLYVGSPARRMRPLTDAELESLRESSRRYVELKRVYLGDNG